MLHSISFCQGLRPSEEEVARNARIHDDDADFFTLRHWNINYSTANSPDRFRYRINSGSQQQQQERRSAKINCSNTLDPCHIHLPLMHFRSRSARLRLAVRRGHVVSDQLSGICIFKKPTAHELRVPFGSASSIFSTRPGFQLTMRLTDKCTLCQERKVARQKKNGFPCTFLQDFFSCRQLNLLHEDTSHLHALLLLPSCCATLSLVWMFLLYLVQVSPDIVHDPDLRCFKFSSKSYKIVGPRSQFFDGWPRWSYGHNDIMVPSVTTRLDFHVFHGEEIIAVLQGGMTC